MGIFRGKAAGTAGFLHNFLNAANANSMPIGLFGG
jgi:hypothetical protein